jgi:hypothetical protein
LSHQGCGQRPRRRLKRSKSRQRGVGNHPSDAVADHRSTPHRDSGLAPRPWNAESVLAHLIT